MATLDHIVQRRAAALLIYALSFAFWQASHLEAIQAQAWASALDLLVPLVILLWMASAVFLIWQSRRHGARTGGDELTRSHRAQALAAGYWTVTLLIAAGLVAGARLDAPPADLLRVLLIVAIAVPALSYFYLECAGDGKQ